MEQLRNETTGSAEDLRRVYNSIANYCDAESNDPLEVAIARSLKRTKAALCDVALLDFNDQAMPQAGSNVSTVLLKPVGDMCNMACSYCYERERLRFSHQKKMRLEDMRRIVENLMCDGSNVQEIFLHGGEPLLAGIEFFEALVNEVNSRFGEGKISFGVQSNATLINDEWIEFFHRHEFRVGVSIDGDSSIHDRHRVFPNGNGSFNAVRENISKLTGRVSNVGAIAVVTKRTMQERNSAARIFEALSELGIQYIDVHPALTVHDVAGSAANDNPSPRDFASFMGDLLSVWRCSQDTRVRVRNIENVLENLSVVPSDTCYSSGRCGQILGIEPDGRVAPCTRPFSKHSILGNALEDSIFAIERGRANKEFLDQEARGRSKTKGCEWHSLCGQGNCPHERIRKDIQDVSGRHIYCTCDSLEPDEGFPGFFRALSTHLTSLSRKLSPLI